MKNQLFRIVAFTLLICNQSCSGSLPSLEKEFEFDCNQIVADYRLDSAFVDSMITIKKMNPQSLEALTRFYQNRYTECFE